MRNLIQLLLIVFIFAVPCSLLAQDGVGIGTVQVSPDAVLDVSSESKGLLVPRVSTSDRSSMTAVSGGLLVYDKNFQAFFYYDSVNVTWKRLVEENSFGTIPVGGIIMWSGQIADLPDNFKLCDGGNGTPDLTDRFVIGGSSAGDLDTRVIVTDTATYNYQESGTECSPHEFLYSGTITIVEPPGGFPPEPAPGEPEDLCGPLRDRVGETYTIDNVAMDSCDHFINDISVITELNFRIAIRCDAYELSGCSSIPNPDYYINNEACRTAAQLYKVAFIMRVE
ncbi:hypothetical protein [Marinoscillum sp.]|uniref:hypothetical protein n=1 Tax=Marinoscillum sp. TaxID=2024838 RepID=UPI003BABE0E9